MADQPITHAIVIARRNAIEGPLRALLGMLEDGESVVKTAPPSAIFPQKPTGY